MNSEIETKQIVLHKVIAWARAELPEEMLGQISSDVQFDRHLRRMVLQIRSEVLEDKVASSSYSTRVPCPVSFKFRHRDSWWMKLWLKVSPIEFEDKVVGWTCSKSYRFPESTIPYPDALGRPILAETVVAYDEDPADIYRAASR